MRRMEEIEIPAHKETRCVERVCDLCGAKAKGTPTGNEWNVSSTHDSDETEIRVMVRQQEGSYLPEGGWGTKIEVDLCPECFKDRLIPWLRSHGAKIEQQEWDY